jgi:transcriptional regulator with XRE-family HTH domain
MTGKELRELRISKGLTQEQLAFMLGFRSSKGSSCISGYESGRYRLAGPVLEAIKEKLVIGSGAPEPAHPDDVMPAKEFKRVREELNLTQSKAAALLGMRSPKSITKLENGQTRIGGPVLVLVRCRFLPVLRMSKNERAAWHEKMFGAWKRSRHFLSSDQPSIPGAHLAEIQEALGLSGLQMAKALGMSPGQWSTLKLGHTQGKQQRPVACRGERLAVVLSLCEPSVLAKVSPEVRANLQSLKKQLSPQPMSA